MKFQTVNARNQALTFFNDEVASRPRWGDIDAVALVGYGSIDPALMVSVSLTTRAEGDTVWERLRDAFMARNPRPGSRLTLHTCTHDENTNECIIVNSQEW
jgi:hypothetical protein